MLIETIRRKIKEKKISRENQRRDQAIRILDDIVELIEARCSSDSSKEETISDE